VLLSGLPSGHFFRTFLYNRILALPRICVVTSVAVRKGVTLVSVAWHVGGSFGRFPQFVPITDGYCYYYYYYYYYYVVTNFNT
jgi:hypothetical protein